MRFAVYSVIEFGEGERLRPLFFLSAEAAAWRWLVFRLLGV